MHYYLVKISYLGFRYHGFQIQPKFRTVQGMVDKTLFCILEHKDFKTLGAGRTDSKVSANEAYFEIFIGQNLECNKLLEDLNVNFPPDIKALSVEEVDKNFQIINHSKLKEYQYFFSYGEKHHPFASPMMVSFPETLDVELMKRGAKIFEGVHYFEKYCYKPNSEKELTREVLKCEIKENDIYSANFFPKISFVLIIQGKGFLRKQVRMIMGALFDLGKGKRTLESISRSLVAQNDEEFAYIAPASGLILNRVEFDRD